MVKRSHFSFRINVFFFSVFVLFSVLIVKLALLQFVEGKQMSEKETLSTTKTTLIAPIRGNIYDLEGSPIASTYSVQSLFYRYGSSSSKEEVVELAKRLADVFAKYGNPDKVLSAEEIISRMDVGYDLNQQPTREPGYSFIPRRIKADLSQKEIAYLSEHRDEFQGIEISEESARKYETGDNQQPIAAQLIGYMRPFARAYEQKKGTYFDYYKENESGYLKTEDVGFDGLEFMYQEQLRGKPGTKVYPVNAAQKIIGPATVTPPEKGDNLYLTIDKDVQLATQQAITDQLQKIRTSTNRWESAPNARSGYAVAMDVDTGAVVAMASMPDYDPNMWIGGMPPDYYAKNQQFINNGTITFSYPDYPAKDLPKHPNSIVYLGSTVKPATILLGLREGFYNLNTIYNDTGTFYFGKNNSAHISNDNGHGYGPINASQAIEHSSNTFMSAMIGNPLYMKYFDKGLNVWDDFMKQFGLGVLTGSGLPNESTGVVDYFENVRKGLDSAQSALVRASWGQQARYTTLQLAQYATTLATRGKRLKPQFVDRIETYDGKVLSKLEKPEVLNEISLPDPWWNAVVAGMKKVHVEGFDGAAYDWAAKTGTSTQQVSNGQLVENAVFIAFAPAEKPKLAVAVVIPEGGYGAWGAAPIARKIFDAYDKKFGLDGVPKGKPAGQ